MKKDLKSRNPIARALRKLGHRVKPGKRGYDRKRDKKDAEREAKKDIATLH